MFCGCTPLFFYHPHICPFPWPYGEEHPELLGKGQVMTETEKLKISKLRRDGLGYKKIAAVLDLPVNSVKTYLRRHPADEDAAAIPDFCERCGKPIIQAPHRKRKRFCSDSCRISWWNAHPDKGGKRILHTFTCAYCGRSFQSGAKGRRYCSRTCYAAARKKVVNADG